MHIGVAAKGVLAIRLEVAGRAAHGATPWLGDNAILKAYEIFRSIESLPFAAESSELFDRPSINLGRIMGGDALNKVPDTCVIDVDIRYLPEQDPAAHPATRWLSLDGCPGRLDLPQRPPALVDRDSVYVRSLCDAAAPYSDGEVMSVGRDGSSDAVSFLRAGDPGGRVRPDRRRPPRARGMGLDLLAGELPPHAHRLHPQASRLARSGETSR